MVLVSAKGGFSFWFQVLPKRRGWGISASFDFFGHLTMVLP